ncbi:PadR family transcriptional regulator [Laceyella putida]|uniref:PadR family transcriptional regulator n=1 Tax=Laceyella putida TaxID=110101 RepID=A0ABW2RP07_9BACL
MNAQFKKGVLTLCVLVLAKNKDRYGYELVQSISEKFLIAEGTIYPLLRRLTKEGYFSTYLLESTEGPPRKYYRLTDKGAAYLDELIKDWRIFAGGVNWIIAEGLGREDEGSGHQ